MPELAIEVRGAAGAPNAATPTIAFQLAISATPASQAIQTVLLNCQIQIEAHRRRYSTDEQALLRDVFGEPERWAQTLRPLLWTNLTISVPGFTGSISAELTVPCSLDLDSIASKYFEAISLGAVPVSMLFSGTIFYCAEAGVLQASPISWNTEARFVLPAAVWNAAIYPHRQNAASVRLRRDVFERLREFRVKNGFATFDEAVESMLKNAVPLEAQWTGR